MTRGVLRHGVVLLSFLALALAPSHPQAGGTPDWAKPYLNLPTPTGAYIAKKDRWVVVYGEVEFGVEPGGGLKKTTRCIFECLGDSPQTFTHQFAHDEGVEVLTGIALNIDRGLYWQSVNVERKSLRATSTSAGQVFLTSVERVEPHRRVVLEYVRIARYNLLPWQKELFAGDVPIATLRVSLAQGSPASLKLRAILPVGDAPPSCLVKDSETSWTIHAVPARSRLPRGYSLQPGWTSLYPWMVAYDEPGGSEDRVFVRRYLEVWESVRKAQENVALAGKARELVGAAATDFEKALKICDFVQHKVQFDDSNRASIHFWVPLEAEETLRSLRGDCKGKTLLAQSLLKAVGIESAPVLLQGDREYFAWGPEPATSGLNHVILAVKLGGGDAPAATLNEGPASGWVLFDPTVETASFGEPLPGDEGLPAFLAQDGVAPRFTIHTKVPAAARLSASVLYRLDAAGGVRGKIALKDNGATPLMGTLATTLSEETIQNAVLASFPNALNRVQVNEMTLRRAGEGGARQMELELSFYLPGATQAMASAVLLENPMALAAYLDGIPNGFWPPTPPDPDERIELSPPWDAKKNAHGVEEVLDIDATVELPAGYLWTPPPSREERTAYLLWQSSWKEERPGVWRGSLHLERHRGSWPAADRKARLKLEDSLFTGLYKSMELKRP